MIKNQKILNGKDRIQRFEFSEFEFYLAAFCFGFRYSDFGFCYGRAWRDKGTG